MGLKDILLSVGISDFELQVVLRLLVASICGAFVGLERERKGSPAGIKTFSAVCFGAAITVIANEYLTVVMGKGTGDIARIGAQVVSGIGFLGAGTILITGSNKIKGLTTAALLWVTATIGLAAGAGFYAGAVGGTLVLRGFSKIYRWFDYQLVINNPKMTFFVDGDEDVFMQPLIEFFKHSNIRVRSLVRKEELRWFAEDTCMVIEVVMPKAQKHDVVLAQIRDLEGVKFCEELL